MTSRSRVRTSAVAATAVAASAALLAGATLGPTAIQSAQPERTLVSDPTLTNSTSLLGGVALDPEGVVTGIPVFGDLAWDLIDDQFGSSTAIAVLPGAAIAAAAKGESATAFALGGLAIATTDITIPLIFPFPDFEVETGQASCIGVLAFAQSSTDGMCLNVLGTFDADYRKDAGEVSFALTNPVALLELLTGDMNAGDLLQGVLDGQPLSRLMTKDFGRLTLGGPNLISGTSDYAFLPYPGAGGAIAIGWLGGQMVLFPVINGGLLDGHVNYLGLPKFNFDGFPKLDSISDIIPSLSVGAFDTPLPGVEIPHWSTGDLLGSTAASTSQRAASASDSIPEAESLSVNVPEVSAKSTAPESASDPAPVETAPSVPEVQPEPEVEPTVTPEPVDPPVAVESTPEVETPSVTESAPDTSGLDGVDDAA